MSNSLGQKTITGMLWSSVQRFGTILISFMSNIILARLLTPDDYGCIGMLMIFLALASTFIDGGLGSALIQKKEPTEEDYSTIFYWNLIISIILYIFLYIRAPLVAQFYGIPLLSSILKVQGIVLIINSLSIIQLNRLKKQLEFKKIATISIVSAVLSVVIAIILAYRGWGVWSLVIQQLFVSFFNTVLLWVYGQWVPLFIFSKKSFKELFNFGSFILLSNLVNTFCNNIQGLLIGKFFAPATMGLYSQARKLEEIASTSFSSVVDQVSYPVLAKVQNDRILFVSMLKKLIISLAYISFPMMIVLILIAEPLITLLYSDKWIECVPYFRILCVAGVAICLQGVNYYGVAAIGKSNELFIWTLVKRFLGIIFIILGFWIYDIIGLLWGMVLSSFMIYIINAYLVEKHIGYRLVSQLKDLLPIIVTSVVAGFLSWWGNYIPMYWFLQMILIIILYIFIYLSISHLFKLNSFISLKFFLQNFFFR